MNTECNGCGAQIVPKLLWDANLMKKQTADRKRQGAPIVGAIMVLALLGCTGTENPVATSREALPVDPGSPAADVPPAEALETRDRRSEDPATYREAIRLNPKHPTAWHDLGRVLQARGRMEEAISALEEAVRVQSNSFEVHTSLASAYLQHGFRDMAYKSYRKALEINPDSHLAWNGVGLVRHEQKQYEEAIAAFMKCLEVKRDYHWAWNNIGIVRRDQMRLEDANIAFEKGLKIKPDWPYGLNNAAWLLVAPEPEGVPGMWDAKDFSRSLNHAQKAVALSDRKDPGYLDTLAWALLRNGKSEDAIRTEEEAIAILVEHEATEANLKDYRRALQVFKAAR